MAKIAISTTSFGEYDDACIKACEKEGFNVVINPYKRKIKPDELIKLARDAMGLIAGTEDITENILLELRLLKVISRCGAGIDNIDVEAARRRNHHSRSAS